MQAPSNLPNNLVRRKLLAHQGASAAFCSTVSGLVVTVSHLQVNENYFQQPSEIVYTIKKVVDNSFY